MSLHKCFAIAVLVLLISPWAHLEAAQNQPRVMAQFVGSTPCDALPRALLEIAATSNCERITWELTLFTNSDITLPVTFTLVTTYGMQAHNSSGFIGGGKRKTLEGKWIKMKATKDNPDALVYELRSSQGHESITFVSVSENLLHLLDTNKHLMVGDASWSYTLNRKTGDR
jgi:hypothetical protein